MDFIDKTGKDPILLEWWKKAEGERKEGNRKQSIIIFKRNRRNTCVMIRLKFLVDLVSRLSKIPADILVLEKVNNGVDDFIIMDYLEFFKWFTPATLEVL